MLATPLRSEAGGLGVILIRRREVRPFTEREIARLEIFARLAATAIERERLSLELREALDQQTAMSEVLGSIAGSPTDVPTVLESIARNALRVSHSSQVTVVLVEGDILRVAVRDGQPMGIFAAGAALPIDDTTMVGRAVLARHTVQVEDSRSTGR